MLRERKYFRGEQSPFINKTLCLIIIKRTIETNIFLKNRTKKNRKYTQRKETFVNHC